MSYILDALQRADAERARGGVPTLHARPVVPAQAASGLSPRLRAGLALGAGLTVLAAALAWWLWPTTSANQSLPAAQTPAATPTDVGASVALVPLPAPASVPTRAVATVVTATTVPPPPLPATAATTATSTPVNPAKSAASAATAEPAPTTAAAPATQHQQQQIPLLSDLPEATRRQIPAMAISGAVYSENPAQRLLLVNGLVLNQGAQVAPDLTVVEIRSNNSEFNFRGTRFRVMH